MDGIVQFGSEQRLDARPELLPSLFVVGEYAITEVSQHLGRSTLADSYGHGAWLELCLVRHQAGHRRQEREANLAGRRRDARPHRAVFVRTLLEGTASQRLGVDVSELDAERPGHSLGDSFDEDLDWPALPSNRGVTGMPELGRVGDRQCEEILSIDCHTGPRFRGGFVAMSLGQPAN